MAVLVVCGSLPAGAQPGATTSSGAPLAPPFEAVFGPVLATGTAGGPAQGGFTPGEAATFSGTKDGRRALLYRLDSTQAVVCDKPPTPATCNQTWIWDGAARTWTDAGVSAPEAREGQSAAAMDEGSDGQAWIYSGGYPGVNTPGVPFDEADMYVFGDDGQWSPAPCSPTCAPGALDGSAGAASATDSLLFGGEYSGGGSPPTGFDGDGFSNQTWRWNGSDWDLLATPGPAPVPRAAPAFGFDGRDFILFGGARFDVDLTSNPPTVTTITLQDTWRLSKARDGTWAWSQVCDLCAPPFRFQTNLVGLYRSDAPEPGAVMVGGYQFTGGASVAGAGDMDALSDVWAWDGTTWKALDAGVAPCSFVQNDPPPFPPCVTDPAIPFTPFMAPMPTIGAAAWTAGSCTGTEPQPPPGPNAPTTYEQVCDRATTQVQLVAPAMPAATPAAVPAVAVVAAPAYTG